MHRLHGITNILTQRKYTITNEEKSENFAHNICDRNDILSLEIQLNFSDILTDLKNNRVVIVALEYLQEPINNPRSRIEQITLRHEQIVVLNSAF